MKLPAPDSAPEPTPHNGWDDDELVEACLAGDASAWKSLVDRYKGLIYSIPFRYRLSAEDAADVFQEVCIVIYQQLGSVRDPRAMRSWVARVTANECFRRKRALARISGAEAEEIEDPAKSAPEWIVESERMHGVREALRRIQPRCQQMIRMLFYDDPPRPYQDVAKELGLAVGSIGFIRSRCLRQLERSLRGEGL